MAKKVHYGWYIVAVCMLMMFGASLVSTGLSVSLNALHEMGVSETETSLIILFTSAMSLVSTLFAEAYFRRLGLRKGMLVAVLSGTAAFAIYAAGGTDVYVYYVGALFGGVMYGLGFTLSTSMLIRRWFNKSRGFALGLSSAGSAISIAVGTPMLQSVISNVDLKTSFIAEAVFMAILAVLVLIVIRDDPSDIGLEPYGGVTEEEREHKTKFALSGTVLAMFFAATLLLGVSGFPATSNLSLNFNLCGLDAMSVAFGISVFGVLLIFSKILCGHVVDRFGAFSATVVFGAFMAVGLLCCFLVTLFPNYAFMYITFVILGIGYPITTLGYTNWASEFTTREEYPNVLKKLQIAFQIGILAGSPLAGPIGEATGNFGITYIVFAISVLVSMALVSVSYFRAGRRTCG